MRTIFTDTDSAEMAPCVATIGFFDGVHRGHRYLIKSVTDCAAASPELQSTVITFDRHPRQVLNMEFQPKLLSTLDEKLALLSKTGADNCVVLHFDREMAAMTAYDFMRDVLRDRLNVRRLIMGYDNRFGHSRTEGFDDYVGYGREIGIEVVRGNAFVLNGVNVSSSVIRTFLSGGEADMAAMCLGYPYFFSGKVKGGYREGRKLGFPTANIEVDDAQKLIPEHGVYAVKVRVEGCDGLLNGMMNIGTRPTFDGHETTLEVNIFDFEEDIYGRQVDVLFYHRLRDEQKFCSIKKLVDQLWLDREAAEKILERV